MCGPGVKIVCFLLLLVAKDGLAGVCFDETPPQYGLHLTQELNFITATKCCKAYDMEVFEPRQSSERDVGTLRGFLSSVNDDDYTYWLPFNDMAKEKRIVNPNGISLSLFEHVRLKPGNSEEKDCIIRMDSKKDAFEWVKCDTKHRLLCKEKEKTKWYSE